MHIRIYTLIILLPLIININVKCVKRKNFIDLSNKQYLEAHHKRERRQISNSNNIDNSRNCQTTNGVNGKCLNLNECSLPRIENDIWKLLGQLCVIEGTSIGICCPHSVIGRQGAIHLNAGNDNKNTAYAQERGCGRTTKRETATNDPGKFKDEERPWMAAILRELWPNVWCGGVLVTDRHVLTAAHCLHKKPLEEFSVRLGEYNTNILNETRSRDFGIAVLEIHVDYDPLTYENDIALLRIERSALFNTYIWPVCLPTVREEWAGQLAVISGWGSKSFAGPASEVLMEVIVPIWLHTDCQEALVERIPNTVLCAGIPSGGQDSCQGDSGGPLLVQLPDNRWIVAGIVSWGIRCGEVNHPGVYTRVDKYLKWIIQHSII